LCYPASGGVDDSLFDGRELLRNDSREVSVKKVITLLLVLTVSAVIAGCGSAPPESDNSSAQRSRAEKAQSELDTAVSKQRSGEEQH